MRRRCKVCQEEYECRDYGKLLYFFYCTEEEARRDGLPELLIQFLANTTVAIECEVQSCDTIY